jgi:hypothetical protein
LYFWGYVDNPEDPDNTTPFYKDFKDDQRKEDLEIYKNYKKLNEECLANLGKPVDKIPQFTY